MGEEAMKRCAGWPLVQSCSTLGLTSASALSLLPHPPSVSSSSSKPLQIWDKKVRNGHIKRITDQDIQSSVLEIMGTNVSTNYITCPADPKKTLGIKLPFLVSNTHTCTIVRWLQRRLMRSSCVVGGEMWRDTGALPPWCARRLLHCCCDRAIFPQPPCNSC